MCGALHHWCCRPTPRVFYWPQMDSARPPVDTTGGDVAGPHLPRDLRARAAREILTDLLSEAPPAASVARVVGGFRGRWAVAVRHAWWWLLHEVTGAPTRDVAALTTGESFDACAMKRAAVGQPFVCLTPSAQWLIRAVLRRRAC